MCMHMLSCLPLLDTSAMSELESFETVTQWLHVLHLEQYTAAFQRAGLATLHQCHSLTADQLECMGITLPGHRRRILASLMKTHGIGQLRPIQQKKTQCLTQTGNDKAWPGFMEKEDNSICKEREKNETERLSLRTRQKPVPRERQVSRKKEESGGVTEHNPMPRPRQMPLRTSKTSELGGEMKNPVPKERTKFSTNISIKSNLSTFDTSLPPIPPRGTPNCPPVCFIPHLNPTATIQTPFISEVKRQAPVVRRRNVTQSLILHDQTAYKPVFSFQTQTLPTQSLTGDLGGDRARKTPGSLIKEQISPLPPKIGIPSNCQPPISQDVLAQLSTAHG